MADKKKIPAVAAPSGSDKKKALETAIAKIENSMQTARTILISFLVIQFFPPF